MLNLLKEVHTVYTFNKNMVSGSGRGRYGIYSLSLSYRYLIRTCNFYFFLLCFSFTVELIHTLYSYKIKIMCNSFYMAIKSALGEQWEFPSGETYWKQTNFHEVSILETTFFHGVSPRGDDDFNHS